MTTSPSAQSIHASAVALDDHAVLIEGPSGSGKSDLCLRLIDRGALLIGDDRVIVARKEDRLLVAPEPALAGKLEVRQVGICEFPHIGSAPVSLVVRLTDEPPRLPLDRARHSLLGISLPLLRLRASDISAPIKIALALRTALANGDLELVGKNWI